MKLSNETKIGALTVFSITLLIIGFNLLKGNNIFSRSRNIYALYDNVEGLATANPVEVNGKTIGSVSAISILNQGAGRILVTMKIDKDILIPSNSVASISSPELLGTKIIDVDFGNAVTYLHGEDTIQTGNQPTLTENLLNNLEPISASLKQTLVSLDTLLLSVHSVLDLKTQKNLRSGIAGLNRTIQDLSRTTKKVRDILDNLVLVSGNLKQQNDTIKTILANASRISSQIEQGKLRQTLQNLSSAVNSLNGLMAGINRGQGTLGLLLKNPQLYDNLQADTRSLNTLLEDLRLNPQRYVRFSLFGRKNKTRHLPSDSLSR